MSDIPAADNGTGQRGQANHIELCRRPLRRAVKGPHSDAAGAITGEKGAKAVRLRGVGKPPQSEKEWEYHPSKQFIPGKSFASSMPRLLQQREGPAEQGSTDDPVPRTSVRVSGRSHEAHLSGSGAAVASPAEVVKPLRRPGTAGPRMRTERMLGMDADGGEPAPPTYALLGSARRDVFVTSRAGAAPACVLLTKTQTRSGYDSGRSAYGDVLQYRHSGGICPLEYKLVTERPAAPQLAPPSTQLARDSFFDSRNGYNANKMRSQMSDVIIGH